MGGPGSSAEHSGRAADTRLVVAHGTGPGSARRGLAGVLFVGAAITAAGTTALLVGYAPLAVVAFGVLWALVVSRRLDHRELAVLAGMVVALMAALPIIGVDSSREVGMVVMAALATLRFWRFLVEGYWPWLAAAIARVTALVFWAVGGADRPALAILVAGLVLLGSSALGMLAARRGRASLTAGDASPPPA